MTPRTTKPFFLSFGLNIFDSEEKYKQFDINFQVMQMHSLTELSTSDFVPRYQPEHVLVSVDLFVNRVWQRRLCLLPCKKKKERKGWGTYWSFVSNLFAKHREVWTLLHRGRGGGGGRGCAIVFPVASSPHKPNVLKRAQQNSTTGSWLLDHWRFSHSNSGNSKSDVYIHYLKLADLLNSDWPRSPNKDCCY